MSIVAFMWQQSYGLLQKKPQNFFLDFSTFESLLQKLSF